MEVCVAMKMSTSQRQPRGRFITSVNLIRVSDCDTVPRTTRKVLDRILSMLQVPSSPLVLAEVNKRQAVPTSGGRLALALRNRQDTKSGTLQRDAGVVEGDASASSSASSVAGSASSSPRPLSVKAKLGAKLAGLASSPTTWTTKKQKVKPKLKGRTVSTLVDRLA